ncbi:MAG: hypothetical protein E6I55_09585 [Chloroflexi bacterium]|nr:MAG: hypothetical protein E6I55_09585 [Chloroflexota bacterium]
MERESSRRRWPAAAITLAAIATTALGVGEGAARSTADAVSTAADLASSGRFGQAIAMDDAIATRTGPIYVLDRSDAQNAALNAARTMLAWAENLDRSGHVDQALAVAGMATDSRLASSSDQVRASLLLEAAKADAARGDFATALRHLDEIRSLGLTSATSELVRLVPQYEVGEATRLTVSGNGADAVVLLDTAAQQGPSGQAAAASVLPAALLAAAEQELSQGSYREAAAALKRLVSSYPDSAQAQPARVLLDAPQPVTGALVNKNGRPINANVRLSSHFVQEAGGYVTSGPFYYSSADRNGDFRFDAIPQGGPYVLEVFINGNWMTFVDPSTGQPANPVNVTPLVPVDLTIVELPS